MNWLSSLFNSKIIKERVRDAAMELVQQNRDHDYSCENSALKHVDSLHRLLNEPSYKHAKARKDGFSFSEACQYLRAENFINKRQSALLFVMTQQKKMESKRAYQYLSNIWP